jgi:hypothetical protein
MELLVMVVLEIVDIVSFLLKSRGTLVVGVVQYFVGIAGTFLYGPDKWYSANKILYNTYY